jgi:1-acyl-sn-glycerol-3-phosphate acyltransferase
MGGFCWYARRMVRRDFYSFALDDSELAASASHEGAGLVVYANHPSWWDPIVAMLLCQSIFPDRDYYAAIDDEALQKYPSFKRLGYFGIQRGTKTGVEDFLRLSRTIINSSRGSLWITPEGTFVDPRHPDPPFMPGIAHLATKQKNCVFLPLAIEYPFIEQRRPLIACKFGEPIRTSDSPQATKEEWNIRLRDQLRKTQAALAMQVSEKQWEHFRILFSNRTAPTVLTNQSESS